MSNTAQTYRFGNRIVRSATPLPSLQAASDHAATDIQIMRPTAVESLPARNDWLHEWRDATGIVTLQLAASDTTGYILRVPALCDFLIDTSSQTVHPICVDAVTETTFEHLLIDQILPRVLASAGELVVHAACVRVGDSCALFLGQSGWGKSTLSGLMLRRGHRPMTDDCTLLDIDGDHVVALATYPSLRLYEDSLRETFKETPALRPVADYTGKQRVSLDMEANHVGGPRRVRAVYLLNDPSQPSSDISIEPLPSARACVALIEHGFRLEVRSREHAAGFLHQAAAAATRLRAFTLRYPRNHTLGERLVRRLEEHFFSLPHHTARPNPTLQSAG